MPVHSTHPDYDAFISRWLMCRDAVEGEHAIKQGRSAYLPMLSGHHDPKHGAEAYEAYLGRALWFGATDRTLNGYVGAIMRRDPAFEVPSAIAERLKDVTGCGQNAVEFTHAQLKELLTTGRYGLLVDKPTTGGVNDMPFIKIYYPENILNWCCDDNGVLQFVTLLEVVYKPKDGDRYLMEAVKQIRELSMEDDQYVVRLHEQQRDGDGALIDAYVEIKTETPTMRGAALEAIPFVFVSCDKDAHSCSKPPMMDLVTANINHYQLDADYRHGLHFTALPTPVFTGITEEKDYFLGSEVAINLRNENSKAFFLEFQGTGLTAIKDAMEERKAQMAALGAALIQRGKQGKGVETAEAARIQHSGETSLLATVVGRVEEGCEKALNMVAAWHGAADAAASVVLNRDFIDAALTAADITALVLAWQSGGLPTNELYWNFLRGGVVNPATSADQFSSEVEKSVEEATKRAAARASQPPALGQDTAKGQPGAAGQGGAAPSKAE